MTPTFEHFTQRDFTIVAADGFALAATSYEPEEYKATIVIAGATGVPQQFYQRFSRFAADNGYRTVTFDYRGIGRSKVARLKGFKASFLDWARLDLAAVIDEIATGETPTFIVGHSFGGHAFGLLPNHYKISGMYVFATGAGWRGWMTRRESIRVNLLWNAILPALTFFKGYTPMSMLGMGEDLPYGVYQQWRQWCKYPHYFFDDPIVSEKMQEKFAQINVPIVAANAVDDLWALPKSRDAFMQGYINADLTLLDIPLTASLPKIGHMGYFRASAQPLWENVLSWIETTRNQSLLYNPS